MAKMTKAEKLADKRIEKAYYATCSGISIPMMKIGEVFKVGRAAVAEGADDVVLAEKIRAFVESIRM